MVGVLYECITVSMKFDMVAKISRRYSMWWYLVYTLT